MKKISLVVMIVVLLVGCSAQEPLVKELYSEIKEVNNFVSISVIEYPNGLQIKLNARKDKKILGVDYWINKMDILDIDYDSIKNTIRYLKYQIYDLNEELVNEISVFFQKENDSLERTDKKEFVLSPKKADRILAWGEGSLKGINTKLNYLQKIVAEKVENGGVVLGIIKGKYEFEKRTPSLAEQSGYFEMWFDLNNKVVIEKYKGQTGTNSVMRQIWLNEDPEISFDMKVDFDTLITNFLKYYNKVNFDDYMGQ